MERALCKRGRLLSREGSSEAAGVYPNTPAAFLFGAFFRLWVGRRLGRVFASALADLTGGAQRCYTKLD